MNIEISKSNYACKALAIFCAVTAHCVNSRFSAIQLILALLGTLGVPVFLILSGYTLNTSCSANEFWKKKAKTICIPWLLYGVATYILHIFADKLRFDIISMAKWIFGYGTWLYFVPVLLICFAVFRLVKTKKWIFGLIAISAVAIIAKSFGIFRFDTIITDYLDPLSWIFYFGLGVLLKDCNIKKILDAKIYKKVLIWILTVALGVFYIMICKPTYWTIFSIPMSLMFFLSIMFLSKNLGKNNFWVSVGRNTFPIYFLHMQIGINIVNIIYKPLPANLNAILQGTFDLIYPVLVVLVTFAIVRFIACLAKFLRLEKHLWILGISNYNI